MRYCFLDTSAFAKLYVVESGMNPVRNLVRSARVNPASIRVLLCDLTLPETFSAVARVQKAPDAARRGLSESALRTAFSLIRQQFAAESRFLVVPASGCMELAADLVERYRLHGADSVQLAAALQARAVAEDARDFLFVSDDAAQCRAAENEGLEVLRPAA